MQLHFKLFLRMNLNTDQYGSQVLLYIFIQLIYAPIKLT